MIEVASIADHADECAARLESRSAAPDEAAPRPEPSFLPPAAVAQVKRGFAALSLPRAGASVRALSARADNTPLERRSPPRAQAADVATAADGAVAPADGRPRPPEVVRAAGVPRALSAEEGSAWSALPLFASAPPPAPPAPLGAAAAGADAPPLASLRLAPAGAGAGRKRKAPAGGGAPAAPPPREPLVISHALFGNARVLAPPARAPAAEPLPAKRKRTPQST